MKSETEILKSESQKKALTRRARITITIVKEPVVNVLNTIPNHFSPVNRTAGEKCCCWIRSAA